MTVTGIPPVISIPTIFIGYHELWLSLQRIIYRSAMKFQGNDGLEVELIKFQSQPLLCWILFRGKQCFCILPIGCAIYLHEELILSICTIMVLYSTFPLGITLIYLTSTVRDPA
jgi:hypothetical protein